MKSLDLKSLQEIVWIAFFSALLAVSAFISLPIGTIPFTLQVLVLFLLALLLGPKRALIAVSFYIFLGLLGFPFFAGGKSGLATLLAPTGGFIVAFMPTAFIAGFAQNKNKYIASLILLLALAFLYLCGASWLMFSLSISWQKAFSLAVAPFIIPDLIKIIMAYVLFQIFIHQSSFAFPFAKSLKK